jgi:protein-tyrosine phosphatase
MVRNGFKRVNGKPELYSGCCPETETLDMLYSEKFDCIWNMAKELSALAIDEKNYCELVVEGQIEDFSIPDNKELFNCQVKQITSLLNEGKKVFIHCMGGRGRTGLAIGSVLVAMGQTPEEALEVVLDHCGGPDTKEQADFVREFKVT